MMHTGGAAAPMTRSLALAAARVGGAVSGRGAGVRVLAKVSGVVIASYLRNAKWLTSLFALGLGGLVHVVMRQIARSAAAARRLALTSPSAAQLAALRAPSSARMAAGRKKSAPSVDRVFFDRVARIFRIVVPSWRSKEAFMLLTQFWFLVVRSLISLRIAKISGDALECIALRSWTKFYTVLGDFFVSGVAAAVTNSGLKYLSNMAATSFRRNLTEFVHARYTRDRNYYKAAVLHAMGGHLDNADQRIVADLNDFCQVFSDLYSYTFKPLLDVILCTGQMARTIGSKGPSALYLYFVFVGALLRAVSPPFSKYIAQVKSLEGDFRRGHSRLITNAEEVAFLNGAERERSILNAAMQKVTAFSERIHLLHLRQGLLDQYGLKYLASMVGFPVLALPFLLGFENITPAEAVSKYKTNDALIQQACRAVGDLVMVYKKVQTLAGYTARVSELLEAIDTEGREGSSDAVTRRGVEAKANGVSSSSSSISVDGHIRFEKVSVRSPDERLLLRELDLEIAPGESVLVTGPNGAGKTSLFRVLAGLWAPSEGHVARPAFLDPLAEGAGARAATAAAATNNGKSEIFYVPQKPYLVTGTLRDQILYPLAPSLGADQRVKECLDRVGLTKLLTDEDGLDAWHHDWADVLSGGEKQRIGLARLYFHQPRFAILDEATSAINADEEGPFYQHLKELGITVFSIAHRLELRRFHEIELTLVGDGKGNWTLKRIHKDPELTLESISQTQFD
uniref:Probable ATP-dependent transporter ycf16 n=1 Tax=Erythrolobus australicus TaxID=1077150 RepID=A0A6T5WRH5_9RHOD|mmetsp:Transcript_4295/g.11757  ORF Transcript_4295/g.11757 Transcript_4295/m.11757 type:complete len:739 (+) Transcript_4295:3-2219(+)